MKDFENDSKMPWNQRTWLDTFVKNGAFEKHCMDMIVAMDEVRKERDASRQRKLDADARYVDTVAMLLGLRKDKE